MSEHLESASPAASDIMAADQAVYINCFGNRTPVVLEYGSGCYATDVNGVQYLDMLGGIAVNLLGHANPHLIEAITGQAARMIHCSNLYYNAQQTRLAGRLTERTGMSRAFFCNSGAEANEAAIKLARGYYHAQGSPRCRIYSAVNSFHGRTLATITATGQPKYNRPFAPLPPGFDYLPFNDIGALSGAVSRPDTAAILLELIQGESGVHPVSQDYAETAERLCKANGVILIIDEVQTGMGRTGAFTASQAYNIRPDIITMAKGLGGGVPIGAMLAQGPVCEGFTPGAHGTTFGGNPLACAAANAVLDEYDRLDLSAAAARQGRDLMEQLGNLAVRFPEFIEEIRGRGLMIGIDFTEPCAAAVRDALLSRRVLVNATGPSTLRLLPPLILSTDDIDLFCARLAAVFSELEPSEG